MKNLYTFSKTFRRLGEKFLTLWTKSSGRFVKIAFYLSIGLFPWKKSVWWPIFIEMFLRHWTNESHRSVWSFSVGSSQLQSMFSSHQLKELHFSTNSYLFSSFLDIEQTNLAFKEVFFGRVVKTSFHFSWETFRKSHFFAQDFVFCILSALTKIFWQGCQNSILRFQTNKPRKNNFLEKSCFQISWWCWENCCRHFVLELLARMSKQHFTCP